MTDRFILTRQLRNYTQSSRNPKISIDQKTYSALQDAALQSGQTISSIARQAINFALERLSWVDEE